MKFLLLFLLFTSNFASASCMCDKPVLADRYSNSDFVAHVKVLKVVEDKVNLHYFDLYFLTYNHFKGDQLSNIKIFSPHCPFRPAENSIWILFARRDKNNFISTSYCSNSIQFDKSFIFYNKNEGTYQEKTQEKLEYQQRFNVSLKILEFFRNHTIATNNNPRFIALTIPFLTDNFKFRTTDKFSVYELILDNKKVKRVKRLKAFSTQELNTDSEKLIQEIQIKGGPESYIGENTIIVVVSLQESLEDPSIKRLKVLLD